MRRFTITRSCVLLLAVAALSGCGPRKSPEQHLAEIRQAHDIIPTGAASVTDADGQPRMVVDLRVTNKSTEPLDHLTILVRVEDAEGNERLSRPMTLDLSEVRPGVGVQLAALVDGFDLDETDMVMVEVEENLSPEALRALPEFSDLPQ